MVTPALSLLQAISAAAENDIDRTEDSRHIFGTERYDKLEMPDAIRILNLFPGDPEDFEAHCELILGITLSSEERNHHDRPLRFELYDALSWYWGSQGEDSWINIREGGT